MYGTKGRFGMKPCYGYTNHAGWTSDPKIPLAFPQTDHFVSEMDAFSLAILEGKPFEPSGTERAARPAGGRGDLQSIASGKKQTVGKGLTSILTRYSEMQAGSPILLTLLVLGCPRSRAPTARPAPWVALSVVSRIPLGGLDHIVAMVAVGLWGAFLGGRAMWTLPVVFPVVMALGGALGVVGVAAAGSGSRYRSIRRRARHHGGVGGATALVGGGGDRGFLRDFPRSRAWHRIAGSRQRADLTPSDS